MTDFFDDPDAVLAKIQRDIADAQARAERATEVRASIDRPARPARCCRPVTGIPSGAGIS